MPTAVAQSKTTAPKTAPRKGPKADAPAPHPALVAFFARARELAAQARDAERMEADAQKATK